MDSELQTKISRFEEWLQIGGVIKPENLKIAYFSQTGLGLKYEPSPVSKSTQKNDGEIELLEVTVPYKLIFCPYLHLSKMKPLLDKLINRFPDFFRYRGHQELLIPHIQGTNLVVQNESSFVIDSELAFTYLAFLIERKKPDSFWRPYFDVLPSQFDSTLFWTEEELAVLRGTNLYMLTKESEKLLHYLFINLHEIEPSITLDEIKFVHALFSSRSYGIKALSNYFSQQRETNLFSILSTETNLNQEEQILSDINAEQSLSCLVPFSDFFNHDCDTKVYFAAEHENNHFCVQIHYNPKLTGAQVFSNYGPKSNEELLLYYGFLVKDNIYNTSSISIPITKTDSNKNQKIELLQKLKIGGKQYLKFNDIPSSLLQGMRIAVMNSNELYFYDVEAHNDHFDKIISIRNEREMWRTLISKLTSLLDNIGDTAHISDVLQNETLSYRMRMGIQYKIEQKNILQNVLNEAIKMENAFIMKKLSENLWSDQFFPLMDQIAQDKALHWMSQFFTSCDSSLLLPENFIISLENPEVLAFLERLQNETNTSLNGFSEDVLLALFIVYELSNNNSKWRGFFDVLPQVLHNGLHFTEELIQELQGTTLVVEVQQWHERLQNEFHLLMERIGHKDVVPNLKWQTFLWAISICYIFSEELVLSNSDVLLCIVPVFPLRYYNPLFSKICHYIEEKKVLKISSIPSQQFHNKIYQSYEGHDNTSLVLIFGLHVLHLENDVVPVEFSLSSEHLLAKEKIRLLEKNGLDFIHFLSSTQISPRLLATVRICMLSDEEIKGDHQNYFQMISIENEMKVLQVLEDFFSQMLQRFPTTIEDDTNLLKSNLSPSLRLAVLYRRSQKQIIYSNLIHIKNHLLKQTTKQQIST